MCPLNLKGAGQISSFNDSFILTTQFLPDWVRFKIKTTCAGNHDVNKPTQRIFFTGFKLFTHGF